MNVFTLLLALQIVPEPLIGNLCAINVVVTDRLGSLIRSAQVRAMGGGSQLSRPDNIQQRIGYLLHRTCGPSVIEVSAPAFFTRRIEVDAHERTTVVIAALDLNIGGGEPSGAFVMLRLRKDAKSEVCSVARIVSLLDPHWHYESYLSPSGAMGIAGVKPGSYAMILLGEKGNCGTATFNVFAPDVPNRAQTIWISMNPPEARE